MYLLRIKCSWRHRIKQNRTYGRLSTMEKLGKCSDLLLEVGVVAPDFVKRATDIDKLHVVIFTW
jgi:hypothetical protein